MAVQGPRSSEQMERDRGGGEQQGERHSPRSAARAELDQLIAIPMVFKLAAQMAGSKRIYRLKEKPRKKIREKKIREKKKNIGRTLRV